VVVILKYYYEERKRTSMFFMDLGITYIINFKAQSWYRDVCKQLANLSLLANPKIKQIMKNYPLFSNWLLPISVLTTKLENEIIENF
jgi:hypothetical protein